ncbi:MAG: peptide-methionine (S)-S-oxide reductase MsrA [Hyphomicrobiaceae bacterium]|nr:peptide-methionine (S)-S-oxide reductase MsrA [Hyphomicrobiaceae bacterium]
MTRTLPAILAVALLALVWGPVALNAQDGAARPSGKALEVATFGSGCFWCTESDFDKVQGVVSTVSGYMGGKSKNPTYREVSTGRTGHVEVLQVTYDPAIVTYKQLLDHFWRTTDVLDGGGQFCDRGNQYRPIIFAHTPEQRQLAERGKKLLDESGRFSSPVAVEIGDASTFTAAEDYHQNYYVTNADGYRQYRYGCGRDRRLRELWGDTVPTN